MISFILNDKIAKIIAAVALFLFLFVAALIFGWPPHYLLGIAFMAVLSYLLFTDPKIFLFFLVIVRMILDYPNEKLNVRLGDSLYLSLSQAIGAAIFVLGVIYIVKNFPRLKEIPLKIPIFLYFIFAVITLGYSVDTFATLKEVFRIFDLVFLFVISFLTFKTRKDFDLLLKVLIASSVIPVIVGVFQYVFGVGYTDAAFALPRIFGTFSHPNSFSLYLLAIIALLFIYHSIVEDQDEKLAVSFLIVLYLLLIVLTYTRIAWLAILVFLLVVGVAKFRKALVATFITIILVYAFVTPIQERINEAIYLSPSNSIAWRINLWNDALTEVVSDDKQALGYGVNTFEIVMENKRGIKFGSTAAHNDYMRSIVEGGVIGLAVFIFYIVYILSYFIYQYRRSSDRQARFVFLTLFAVFLAISLASLSDNVIRNTPFQWIFWIATGASLRVFGK